MSSDANSGNTRLPYLEIVQRDFSFAVCVYIGYDCGFVCEHCCNFKKKHKSYRENPYTHESKKPLKGSRKAESIVRKNIIVDPSAVGLMSRTMLRRLGGSQQIRNANM
jgi:hypothetical protein